MDTIKQWVRIKGIEIIESHAEPDRIHLCLSIPHKHSLAHAISLLERKSASEVISLKTKSSRMVRGRTFWARGYFVSTVGLDEVEFVLAMLRPTPVSKPRQSMPAQVPSLCFIPEHLVFSFQTYPLFGNKALLQVDQRLST